MRRPAAGFGAVGRWGTQTFIAGLRLCGLTAPWVLDGPITRAAFNVYVETQLAPPLDKGDVVMLDNLSSHKSETAAECLKERAPGSCSIGGCSPAG